VGKGRQFVILNFIAQLSVWVDLKAKPLESFKFVNVKYFTKKIAKKVVRNY